MFPRTHHLLSLVPNRAQAAIRRLEDEIWRDITPVTVEATPASPDACDLITAQFSHARLTPVTAPHHWGRLFDQRWCRLRFSKMISATSADAPRFLNWRDQAEATLYIDGKPYFGFDVAHRFCELPAGIAEAWIESRCVQSGIWVHESPPLPRHGSTFDGAFLCIRDDTAWNALHDLKCLLDFLLTLRAKEQPDAPAGFLPFGLQPKVERVSPLYRQLLRSLDLALDACDQRGTAALRDALAATFAQLRANPARMRAILTGHAHIDLVWLWPERIGEFKAVHSFATANYLMSRYPEFRFAYSQPASYEAVRRESPALFEDVTRRIRSGQWQPTGATYVESDTLIACGEALARSFTLGQAGFRELTGSPSPLCWLPDVFGYSACLPQLMKLNGVRYFFTTKMTWNAINRFPHSSFIWRGNDGSEILTHVSQEIGYNSRVAATELHAGAWNHQQADVHREYLMPTGYGDGGGGVTDEMCERARRLDSLADLPAIEWGHPEQFFERLETQRSQLPVHQGECYLEYHRGTYTTHGNLKAAFRALERALQIREAAACATGEMPGLAHEWKRLVFAQFHDYIPGSSVTDVYREGIPELVTLADKLAQQTRAQLGASGSVACIFNPHPLEYRGWISDAAASFAPRYVELAPLTSIQLTDVSAPKTPPSVEVLIDDDTRAVRNGLAEFHLNKDGHIIHLAWEGKTVPQTAPLGQLIAYPDRAANFEPWDIDRHVLSLGQPCNAPADISAWQPDCSRAGFSVKRAIGKASSATIHFHLVAGSPLLHIEVELDWREPEHLLKIHFPTAYAGAHARCGIPFGTTLRSQIPKDMASEAMWEMPFSRHLEIFDDGERHGIFLATENKYGASVRDGEIGLSLVRSPRVTGFENHRIYWIPELSRLENASTHSDIGAHTIRLALGRYSIDLPRERQPAAVAETLFTEPIACKGAPYQSPIQGYAGGETLVPAWTQPLAPNAFLLRLHEVAGQRGTTRIRLAEGWRATACDFPGNRIDAETTERAPAIAFSPYQIVSVRIERSATHCNQS